jgi:outer membrane protein TolC
MQKRLNHFYIILFMTAVLTACTVGKNYQRPEVPTPQAFRGVATADTSSMADIEWKQFFTDTTLQGLIGRGIAYNYDLQLAIKRIDEAQQKVKQAKLLQLPVVNLQATAQTTNASNNSLNGMNLNSVLGKNHIEDYSVAANLSWEADIWGKIRRQKEATLANYLQTTEAAKAVQTQIVSDIAQGFTIYLCSMHNWKLQRKILYLATAHYYLQDSRDRLVKLQHLQ